ncbi:hypothetical protein D9756_002868 [Leucocoprinus leucothites]|uniref:Uncharacterized protein n=1 Tax=Leucocoprinus leucothites TaxID=201217 RepID=A0A8H5G6D7_9AGAR|nr:hypothetical protein D9756_002868 [Leucoagaricus leucothites]
MQNRNDSEHDATLTNPFLSLDESLLPLVGDRQARPQLPPKQIFIPIGSLGGCGFCGAKRNLKVCNSCALFKAKKINLKTSYIFPAYLYELSRELGSILPHPAFHSNVIKIPSPSAKKAPKSKSTLDHTIVLGKEEYGYPPDVEAWWTSFNSENTGKSVGEFRRYTAHFTREVNALEITVSVCFALVAGLYFVDGKSDESESSELDDGGGGPERIKAPYYRLEYGQNPICDFGICKGKIQGRTHYVQKWTYHDTKTDTYHTLKDPDNHYWMYFKTVTGDEIVLDCNSSSFGMDVFVDIESLADKLPEELATSGSRYVPALFIGPGERRGSASHPYTLIEEKRFSVLRDVELHKAIMMMYLKEDRPENTRVIKEFVGRVQGEPCSDKQGGTIWMQWPTQTEILGLFLKDGVFKELVKPFTFMKDPFLVTPSLRDLF